MILIGVALAVAFWVIESALHLHFFDQGSFQLFPREADELWMRSLTALMFVGFGTYAHVVTRRLRRAATERSVLQARLEEALTHVLGGFITVCARCKKIREDDERWTPIESYVHEKTRADFSHTVCPDCFPRLYPDFVRRK